METQSLSDFKTLLQSFVHHIPAQCLQTQEWLILMISKLDKSVRRHTGWKPNIKKESCKRWMQEQLTWKDCSCACWSWRDRLRWEKAQEHMWRATRTSVQQKKNWRKPLLNGTGFLMQKACKWLRYLMLSLLQPLWLGLVFGNPKRLRQMGKSREGKCNTWNKVALGNVQTNWVWYKLMQSDDIFSRVLRDLVKITVRSFLITFKKSCWSSVWKPSNFADGTKLGGVVDRSDGCTVI